MKAKVIYHDRVAVGRCTSRLTLVVGSLTQPLQAKVSVDLPRLKKATSWQRIISARKDRYPLGYADGYHLPSHQLTINQ